MTIDRLGPVDPVSRFNKSDKSQRAAKKGPADSVSLSEESKLKAEIFKASEEVRSAQDVRMDRIAEVKKKLEDPSYINDSILELVADRIMESFGLEDGK
ncbi:MAG: flagellar biosynthesis anti-sigma factor FlgM [Spirochaetia bacterium]